MIRKPEAAAQTPMMQQFFAAKDAHPDKVLLFRMGDFFEMFFDDAVECSELLGITLTTRGKDSNGVEVPMAGVPARAVDGYLAKLLRFGKRVAICDQLEDPREAKGIVKRDVVRVVTPGTVTDESIVGEKTNNFIAALVRDAKRGWGLAWIDLTTGQFRLWESETLAAVRAELGRLAPAEIVLPEALAFHLDREPGLEETVGDIFKTPFSDPLFDHSTAYRTLTEHLSTRSLDGFGCEHLRLGIRAGGGLLRYLQETQKTALRHITRLSAFQDKRILPIDRATRHALEITESAREGDRAGTLLATFDKTSTAPGARKLREWLLGPLTEVDAIVARQRAVSELVAGEPVRTDLMKSLREVHDLERLSTRLSYGSANARDLVSLRRTLRIIPSIRDELSARESQLLRRAADSIENHDDLAERLEAALIDEPPTTVREGGIIRSGFNEELDELRSIATEGKQWFARYQERESQRTGIPSLKVGYNKVFGYYVEITNSHRDRAPDEYVRKQTLKNCERYITPDLKEYESKVLHARERSEELEYEVFAALRDEAAERIPSFQRTADALAEVDVLCTFARLGAERGYVCPEIDESRVLRIEDGRHPVVEQVATTEPFIPNSIDLDPERSIMIITGPNMAGKSTYIRQVGLLVLLAQTGSFIPAKSARIGVVDRLFTRVGASDDLTRGQSTFMVEMHETANILNNATDRSLIVLDEVGRGTSTFDGLSLAWAITEHIAEHIEARTLFATHYHELTQITRNYPAAANFNFAVKEWNEDVIFLRKVIEGGADKSYGIHVARLAGIPSTVIERSKEILSNLENQSLDLEDRPAIARTRLRKPEPAADGEGGDANGAAGRAGSQPTRAPLQLDLFHGRNDEVLRDLKRADTDNLTPLQALELLAELRSRIV